MNEPEYIDRLPALRSVEVVKTVKCPKNGQWRTLTSCSTCSDFAGFKGMTTFSLEVLCSTSKGGIEPLHDDR